MAPFFYATENKTYEQEDEEAWEMQLFICVIDIHVEIHPPGQRKKNKMLQSCWFNTRFDNSSISRIRIHNWLNYNPLQSILFLQEQYKFLHELALEYMDKNDTYANFK